MEALHLLETLETSAELDDDERVQVKILKSTALFWNHLLIPEKKWNEARKLANEAFTESQQHGNPVFFVDALLPKLVWYGLDTSQHRELLHCIEKAGHVLQTTSKLSSTDRKRREAYLRAYKGMIYRGRKEFDHALQCYQESLAVFEELGNKCGVMRIELRTSWLYHADYGDHARAVEWYRKCLTTSRELDNKLFIAGCYFGIGDCLTNQGDLDQGMDYYHKSLDTMEELGNKLGVAKLLLEIGESFQFNLRDYARAVEWYRKSLATSRDIDYKHGMAMCYLRIGNYHGNQGDLDQGIECYQKSRELFVEIESDDASLPLGAISLLYLQKGHFEQALESSLKALQITREAYFKMPIGIMQALRQVGDVYHAMGSFNDALNYYQQSLNILEKKYSRDRSQLSWSLYSLFSLHFEHELVEQATIYLQQLEECAEKAERITPAEHKIMNLFYRLAKARVLKNSARFIEKAEAQEILRDIVSEDIIFHQYTIEAMFFLCELLFEELKLSGNKAIMDEVKELSDRIHGIGKDYHAYPVMVNALILQSKLAMLEEDIEGATGLLTRAAQLADEKGLTLFQKRVKREKEDLEAQLEKWKALYERNAPVYERIERARLDEYLRKASEAVRLLK